MKLAIGIDDFKELRQQDYTYVDKSLFIEDVIENPAKIQLITRPRRFGKTLNMSMLGYFFDHQEDNRSLYDGLTIQQRPCWEQCASRPVISVSLKGLKASDFETFLNLFADTMSRLYLQHDYLMASMSEFDLEQFRKIASQKGEESHLARSLARLMFLLEGYHKKKVVLLIDEYDSPIHEAYQAGYYEPVITFMRAALGEALKGNTSLHKAVLTGILRISKESIFSDLNHIEVQTVLDDACATRFGFTEAETLALLAEAGQTDHADELRAWYNGYQIGGHIIYNPWSLLNYLKKGDLQAYWVNTSGNHLIHELLTQANLDTQEQLVRLINGETIPTPIHDQTTLRNLNGKALWSLLLFSGYLTVQDRFRKGPRTYYRLRIPNTEVKLLYQDIFLNWMDNRLGENSVAEMLAALTHGQIDIFEHHFSKLVAETLSYYDTASDASERVYHAFVLGLLANLDYRYHIRSNRESGFGRYDLMMIPKDKTDMGVIMEFKLAKSEDDLDTDVKAALAQIEDKDYGAELIAQGVTKITKIGIAFHGKKVKLAKQ